MTERVKGVVIGATAEAAGRTMATANIAGEAAVAHQQPHLRPRDPGERATGRLAMMALPRGWRAILKLLVVAPREQGDVKGALDILRALEADGLARQDGAWWLVTDKGYALMGDARA
jgi:hypothetical protein